MSSIWKDLRDLFWPPLCPVCGERMPDGARTVCTVCRMDAPLTGFWTQVDNPVVRKFWGLVPVVNASAFLFFVRGNGYRDLIHGFKYYGRWRQALEMGAWYGGELAAGGLYAGVDVVVPVPLHLRKRLHRGYNQAEYIARGIAESLGVPVDVHSVRRHRHNPSQALKEHRQRWENVRGIFSVRRPSVRQTHPPRGRRADYGSDGNLLCRSYPGRRTRRSHQYRRPCRLPPQPRSGLTDKRWFAAIRNDSGRMMVRRNMAGRDR